MRTENTSKIIEGVGEDLIVRICIVVTGGKSGEGKNPPFVKVRAIDDKNNLPGDEADGEEVDVTEGIRGTGPYSEKDRLKIEFYRTKLTTEWKARIRERTQDPEKAKEWVKGL